MKKSFLALAVAAVAATALSSVASATTVYDKDGNSLDIYGRVQSVYYSDKWSNGVSNEDGTFSTSARLGLDLRTQLTSGIAVGVIIHPSYAFIVPVDKEGVVITGFRT